VHVGLISASGAAPASVDGRGEHEEWKAGDQAKDSEN